jgi:hypothetical protein
LTFKNKAIGLGPGFKVGLKGVGLKPWKFFFRGKNAKTSLKLNKKLVNYL